MTQADARRFLWEQRKILSAAARRPGRLPETLRQAENLKGLIPRQTSSHGKRGGNWQPAVFDDPDAAQGIAKVWK